MIGTYAALSLAASTTTAALTVAMLATEICGLETGFRQLVTLKAADVAGLVA